MDESQSTQAADIDTATAVTAPDKPHPAVTKRPVRLRRRPARFLETIQACRLVNRNSAAHAPCRAACCDVTAAGSCQSGCSARAIRTCRVVRCRSSKTKSFACLRSIYDMPRSSIFRSERFASTYASFEAGSGPGMALDRSFVPRSIEGHQGSCAPLLLSGTVVLRIVLGVVPQQADRSVGIRGPTVLLLRLSSRPSAAQIVRTVVCFARDRPTPDT